MPKARHAFTTRAGLRPLPHQREATDNPVAFLVRDSASWFKLPSWPGHRPYYYDSQMRIASVNNITAQYGGQNVLNGVSFEISAGEKLGLIGPNGSGKTTLLRILLGHEAPTGGTVSVGSGTRIGTSRSTSKVRTMSWS